MRKFKYRIRFDFLMGFLLIIIFVIGYSIYQMAMKDINYIIQKHGKVYVSPETSTLFYGSGTLLIAIFIIYIIVNIVKSWISPNTIKVNNIGILVPKNINSKKTIMINYSEISSINTTDKKTTINYNRNKVHIFKRYFDDEYKFNNFSTMVYTNFHTNKKSSIASLEKETS